MEKKLILAIILGMFLLMIIPFTSAYLGERPQNKCVDIKVISNCTSVNLTLVENNNQTFVIDSPMQHLAGQVFNYSFCNISELGYYTYIWDENCVDCSGGICEGSFEITRSGYNLKQGEASFYWILLIGGFMFFSFFFYFSIKLPYSNETNEKGSITRVTKSKYLKLFSILFSYASFLFVLSMVSSITLNFISLDYTKTLIVNFYRFFNIFQYPVTFVIFSVIFIEIWRDMLISRILKKNGVAIPGADY